MLVGKKRISDQASKGKIAAANHYVGKTVYCVDNVDVSVTADELKKFISSMNVNVISCFQVAPRKPSWWRKDMEYTPRRNTFRVCIAREDNHKFLDPDAWPEYISVSTWIFKSKGAPGQASRQQEPTGGVLLSPSHGADDNRQPNDIDADEQHQPPKIDHGQSHVLPTDQHDEQDNHDMETTLNYNHGEEL